MSVDIESLFLFVPIAVALALTPGADMLFALGQGIRSGSRAGLAAGIGAGSGALCHTVAAGLGLAAFLSAYPVAFEIVRWSGVAYLTWLALQAFVSSPVPENTETDLRNSPFVAWRNGLYVNLLNPKVAIFMLALVPQFIEQTSGSVFIQFLIFGSILSFAGAVVNGIVGMFAGTLGKYFSQNTMLRDALQIATGFVFLGLAAKLAFEQR